MPFCVSTCRRIGPSHSAALAKVGLEADDVVAVDRTDVTDPECLEEAVRGHDLAKCDGEPVRSRISERTESRYLAQQLADALAGVDVRGAEPQVGEPGDSLDIVGEYERPLSFRTMTTRLPGVAEVVERLVGHATGE